MAGRRYAIKYRKGIFYIMENRKDALREPMVDVYNLIRSPEIRNFFRENVKLGIFEKEQLILHSYIPLRQKMAMLKQLSYTGNEKEASLIYEMYGFLAGYFNRIYHPLVRTNLELECVNMYVKDGCIKRENSSIGKCYTVDEAVMKMESFVGKSKMLPYGLASVEVIQDGKLRQPFEFSLFRIDGKWQVKDVAVYDIDRDGIYNISISEDTSCRFSNNGFCHPLPFDHGSRLKLQLPSMDKPFYGILQSEHDEKGCWCHYLYDENMWNQSDLKSFIDISYAEVALYSGYSSLDWIERA